MVVVTCGVARVRLPGGGLCRASPYYPTLTKQSAEPWQKPRLQDRGARARRSSSAARGAAYLAPMTQPCATVRHRAPPVRHPCATVRHLATGRCCRSNEGIPEDDVHVRCRHAQCAPPVAGSDASVVNLKSEELLTRASVSFEGRCMSSTAYALMCTRHLHSSARISQASLM